MSAETSWFDDDPTLDITPVRAAAHVGTLGQRSSRKAMIALLLGAISVVLNPLMAVGVVAVVFGLQAYSEARAAAVVGARGTASRTAQWAIALGVIGSVIWLGAMLVLLNLL